MKAFFVLITLLLLQGLFSGCYVFPHGELVTPSASGRILDATDFEPIVNAKVVRQINKTERTTTTFSDNQGDFIFKKDTDLRWLLMMDYGPSPIYYHITAENYRSLEMNRLGGGTLRGAYEPHDLGVILLERISNQTITKH